MCGGLLGGDKPKQQTQQLAERPVRAEPPQLADTNVVGARGKERKRLRALSGGSKSIATSGTGLNTTANTSGKTLLGQ